MMQAKEIRIFTLLFIDTFFFLLEVIVGYSVHSLALIADSFHMLNDIFSLIVALWAVRVAKNKGADAKYTYGWKRAEILGALINAVFLLALCFSILIEAIQRLISPAVITNPKLILYVGFAGLVSNIVGLFLFHEHGHSHGGEDHSHTGIDDDEASFGAVLPQNVLKHYDENTGLLTSSSDSTYSQNVNNAYHSNQLNTSSDNLGDDDHDHEHGHSHLNQAKKQKSLNMHGVFLHVLGDALGNVGVILTAIFIWKTDYSWKYYSDPLISLVITAIIFSSALPLCRKSSRILLQATPSTISADAVQKDVLKVDGVVSVHDFHIWNLTEDIFIASLHVEINSSPDKFLVIASQIRAALHNYGIHSATVQPEFIGNNVTRETREEFTRLAGGSSSSNENNNGVTTAGSSTPYGTSNDQCLVNSAVNCNTDSCLVDNKN